jgi:hypothetical protein
MSKRKNWEYANALTSKHGSMICTHCKKAIETGDYRYAQVTKGHDWEYVTQHRVCSKDDSQWAERDERDKLHIEELQEKLKEYEAFYARWEEEAIDKEKVEKKG